MAAFSWRSVLDLSLAGLLAGQVAAGQEGALPAEATPGWTNRPFVGYVVPALSAVRRWPGAPPPDGKVGDRIDLVAARGEYEPASFMLFPRTDVPKLELKAGELTGPAGRIPAEAVDLKIVKCWYQSGNAWFSPFSDPASPTLVPELLLNDDRLVTVDDAARRNTLRVDGVNGLRYVDIGLPGATGKPADWDDAVETVRDSPVLQPLALRAGRGQQFWLTVRVPEEAVAGLYTGTIALFAEGQPAGSFRVNLRVLPFALPAPRTRHDLSRDFQAVLVHRCGSTPPAGPDGGRSRVEPRWLAESRNMARHNVLHPIVPDLPGDRAASRELPLADAIRKSGGKVWTAGGDEGAGRLGAVEEIHVESGPIDAETAARWHTIGHRVLSGGPPLAGVENPEVWRRGKGLQTYKAGGDGVCLSGYYEGRHAWNDFAGPVFRCRHLVYPTTDGVIDTLAWEAVREALDDVRYMTLLAQLAAEAMRSDAFPVASEGRKAALWFELVDADTADLDTLRLELVAWILKLRVVLGKTVAGEVP